MSALPPKADIDSGCPLSFDYRVGPQLFRDCDAESALAGWLRAAQDLPGLLAWHIILVFTQPRRKRDPNSPMGEAPALGQIVEDHLGSVLVGDS